MKRILLLVSAAIILVLVQLSFLQEFGMFKLYINIVLVAVVFVASLVSFNTGLYFAVTCGVCLDLYSPYSFGLNTLALLAVVLVIDILLKRWLTRVTSYAMAVIMAVSTLVYHGMLVGGVSLMYWLGWRSLNASVSYSFPRQIFFQAVVQALLVSALLLGMSYARRVLKIRTRFTEPGG